MDTKTKIEIIRGSEGLAVVLNGIRVAGSKPWGGGTVEAAWDVPTHHVIDAIGEVPKGQIVPTPEA